MVGREGTQDVSADTEVGKLYSNISRQIDEEIGNQINVLDKYPEKTDSAQLTALEKKRLNSLKTKSEEELKAKIKQEALMRSDCGPLENFPGTFNEVERGKALLKEVVQPVIPEPKVKEPQKTPPAPVVENKVVDKKIKAAHPLSFIEDWEEEEAKKLIEEELGFERPRVSGWLLAVKVWTRPEDIHSFVDDQGNAKSIVLPTMITNEDRYRSCTGLVLAMGPDCYNDSRFVEPLYMRVIRSLFWWCMPPSKKAPLCKVGDWIVFPRNEGVQVTYRGVPMQYIPDDKVLGIVSDPSHVTRD